MALIDRVEVTVPATSANLGPGYDSFGMALDISDEIVATVHDSAVDPSNCVTIRGEGAGVLPTSADHLIHRVAREVLESRGLNFAQRLTLECTNFIPQERGLGSSAAAIVAGISIADALTVQAGLPEPSPQEKLEWAMHYEGHPDNAAPALFGGVSVNLTAEHGAPLSASLPVHPAVRAVLVIPDTVLETSIARELMPDSVPHEHAAQNSARAALFVHAIGHDPSFLLEATADLLHQEYRRPAMPDTLAWVDQLRAAGLAAFVSGAGPTLAVLGTDFDLERRVADVLSTAVPTGPGSGAAGVDGGSRTRIVGSAIADNGVVTTVTPRAMS